MPTLTTTPTLTITRGLPGSGKTTWAKTQPNVVRVNRDDLRRMLHGGNLGEGWAEVQVTVAQRAQVEALLRAGVDVVCDDTNLRAKVVRELAELAAACGARTVLRDFTDVPLQTCLERDAARPEAERVGPEVIMRMHERYLTGKREQLTLPEPAVHRTYTPPVGMPRAILVDLDGTVALMGARSPYDHTRVHLDLPNQPVIDAVRALHAAGHTVVYCSGRVDACREATAAWLDEHVGVPYAALHMRRTGDQRKDSVVKQEIFERELRDNWHVVAVLDDRNQVVRMWRELGLTVFQVADGAF
ncbi:AAA family ATPase [Catellatospora sp. KI3]|uniref:phosphatase domain-containing protein n=1 Tax=Catellatospora sp. KI3 TaxID=3041620 RepID=UPI002482AE78|nr:AAA family ATPase [Catellatospora sp. KI3]MDI1459697.1 AAA family ATPase [Catellatospora sp. KI3]